MWIKVVTLLFMFSIFNLNAHSKARNGEWITASGVVSKAMPDFFILDKGNKKVIVEMDDWDWYKEGYKILKGDRVVVHGKVDQDFLEKRKIEASSVFVKGLNAFFYASSEDEESKPFLNGLYYEVSDQPEGLNVEYTGRITKIMDKKFILNTGLRKIQVDTSEMTYNPLDKKGFLKLDKGDRVKVFGEIEKQSIARNELDAKWVISLRKI